MTASDLPTSFTFCSHLPVAQLRSHLLPYFGEEAITEGTTFLGMSAVSARMAEGTSFEEGLECAISYARDISISLWAFGYAYGSVWVWVSDDPSRIMDGGRIPGARSELEEAE